MNYAAVDRIRSSFDLVAPRSEEWIDTFYALLFAAEPALRSTFPADMGRPRAHLLAAVGLLARHAGNLAAIETPLRDLGARHGGYGAFPRHLPLVRDALVKALAGTAGDAWTKQLSTDWSGAIDSVAALMAGRVQSRAA